MYNELDQLIKNANFNFIFLSYNDEGILSLAQIKEIFSKYGKYHFKTQTHQRFKADSSRIHKQDKTTEYLHILKNIDSIFIACLDSLESYIFYIFYLQILDKELIFLFLK